MITIVDYGLGNVLAFANVYKRLNISVSIATSAAELAGAERVILPGVGSFDYAMQKLDASGMRGVLDELVMGRGVPVLGICVGMQMLAESSEEGKLPGLGWVKGSVRKMDATCLTHGTRLPHMGWNDVRPRDATGLFRDLGAARFYFLHSYYFDCADPAGVIAVAEYGSEFCCAVRAGDRFGVQFHPEKSHHFGVQLLRNYAEAANAQA